MNTITTDAVEATEPRSSRRNLLRLAGAAAVGGAAAGLLSSGSVSAGTGTMQYGVANDSGTSTTQLGASATSTLIVNNSGSGNAVVGQSTGGGTGVLGQVAQPTTSAFGVQGSCNGTQGYGVVATGGQAQLRITPAGAVGPSRLNIVHAAGEVAYDLTTDAMWVCVASGAPGVWRKLAGSSTAGSFHPISPARVYDSRKAAPSPGILSTGAFRTVSIADKRNVDTGAVTVANVVPAGATAISFNLTVVGTVGTNGWLAVNEGGNTTVAASLINWSSESLTTANSTVVKVNLARQVTVICGGTATSCHFIIDVLGYYL